MKDLIRVIQQEAYEYSDPVTQFLECLFVRYDFEGAQARMSPLFACSLSLSCWRPGKGSCLVLQKIDLARRMQRT